MLFKRFLNWLNEVFVQKVDVVGLDTELLLINPCGQLVGSQECQTRGSFLQSSFANRAGVLPFVSPRNTRHTAHFHLPHHPVIRIA